MALQPNFPWDNLSHWVWLPTHFPEKEAAYFQLLFHTHEGWNADRGAVEWTSTMPMGDKILGDVGTTEEGAW